VPSFANQDIMVTVYVYAAQIFTVTAGEALLKKS
jgi:hypothetical protein